MISEFKDDLRPAFGRSSIPLNSLIFLIGFLAFLSENPFSPFWDNTEK